MAALDDCYNIADIRRAAKRRLPKSLFEFIDRATEDELAMRNNREGFERWRILPRAPSEIVPVPIPPSGKAAAFASGASHTPPPSAGLAGTSRGIANPPCPLPGLYSRSCYQRHSAGAFWGALLCYPFSPVRVIPSTI